MIVRWDGGMVRYVSTIPYALIFLKSMVPYTVRAVCEVVDDYVV